MPRRLRLAQALLCALCFPLGALMAPLKARGLDVEQIDALWLGHLRFRIEQVQGRNLIVENYCREALEVAPRDAEVVGHLSEYYLEKGEAAMAAMAVLYLKLLDPGHELVQDKWTPIMEAIRLFPLGPTRLDRIETQSDLAEGLRRAALAREEGDFVRAENYYRLMLTHYPSNQLLLDALGSTYVFSESWMMAAMLYRYALHLYPSDSDFANNYALALSKVGHTTAAIEVLRYQLEQHPRNAVLAKNLGKMLFAEDAIEEASEAFAVWTAEDPTNPEAWELYGETLLKRDKSVFAKVALRKAVELDPAGTHAATLLLGLGFAEDREAEIEKWAEVLRPRMSREEWARLTARPPFSALAEKKPRRGRER